MIAKDQMMGVLLDACPAFTTQWPAFLDEWKEEADDLPLYLALGAFAQHLIGLLERGHTEDFARIFAAVEHLHVEGDEYVKDAASVGVLEDLRNRNLHTHTEPEQFRPFLGAESVRCWDELAASWDECFRPKAQRLGNSS